MKETQPLERRRRKTPRGFTPSHPEPRSFGASHPEGFTLIEMLAVIVIIGILAAITLRVMGYVMNKTGRGKAVTELEQLRHALAEYHAFYGIFPPVRNPPRNTIDWEYKEIPAEEPIDWYWSTGLMYYLMNPDDKNRDRWMPYLDGVAPDYWGPLERTNRAATGGGWLRWTNTLVTLRDPWGNVYGYECYPPYQEYRLWSPGPTGQTNDDIGVGWNE